MVTRVKGAVSPFADEVQMESGETVEEAVNQRTIFVGSVAELEAASGLSGSVYLQGYYGQDTPGGGRFYVDLNDTTTPSDGGLVFVTSDGRRVKRKTEGEVATPYWYGIPLTSDDVDYTEELQSVISFPRFEFPSGFEVSTLKLYPVSNTTGNLSDAKIKLLSGADTFNEVFEFSQVNSGEIPQNIVYYGGVVDGNRGAESGEGEPGGDGSYHGCRVSAGINCHWYGPVFRNCATDGIYVNEGVDDTIRNFHIYGPICDNNSRQGISAAACEDMHIWDTICQNTNGIAPYSGIDIEPGGASKPVNIFFHGTTLCKDNQGRGFMAAMVDNIDSITVERLVSEGNNVDEPSITLSGEGGELNFKADIIETDKGFRVQGLGTVNVEAEKMLIGESLFTGTSSGDFFFRLVADYVETGINDYVSDQFETSPIAVDTDACLINIKQMVCNNASTSTAEGYAGRLAGGDISIGNVISRAAKSFYLAGTMTGGTGIDVSVGESTLAENIRLLGSGWRVSGNKTVNDAQTFMLLLGDANVVDLKWDGADGDICVTEGGSSNKITVNTVGSSARCVSFNSSADNNLVTASYLDSSITPVSDSGSGNVVAGSWPLSVNS